MSDTSGRLFSEGVGANVAPLVPGGTGVYPSQALERLAQTRVISSIKPIEPDQFQPASLDLRLGKRAYRIDASFLPGPDKAVMDRAARYLVTTYNPKGNRVGWLMIASILVEAWDLYSIAFVLVFIRDLYHPSPALLGLAAAGTQGGGANRRAARRMTVRQDRPPGHVPIDDDHVHHVRPGAGSGSTA